MRPIIVFFALLMIFGLAIADRAQADTTAPTASVSAPVGVRSCGSPSNLSCLGTRTWATSRPLMVNLSAADSSGLTSIAYCYEKLSCSSYRSITTFTIAISNFPQSYSAAIESSGDEVNKGENYWAGTQYITIRATDRFGNRSAWATYQISIDTTPPSISANKQLGSSPDNFYNDISNVPSAGNVGLGISDSGSGGYKLQWEYLDNSRQSWNPDYGYTKYDDPPAGCVGATGSGCPSWENISIGRIPYDKNLRFALSAGEVDGSFPAYSENCLACRLSGYRKLKITATDRVGYTTVRYLNFGSDFSGPSIGALQSTRVDSNLQVIKAAVSDNLIGVASGSLQYCNTSSQCPTLGASNWTTINQPSEISGCLSSMPGRQISNSGEKVLRCVLNTSSLPVTADNQKLYLRWQAVDGAGNSSTGAAAAVEGALACPVA